MEKTRLTIFRVALAWALGLLAIGYLYITWGLQLVLIGVVWGVFAVAGMQSSIRNETNPNWGRKTTKLESEFAYLLIFGFIFLPAAIGWFMSGILASVSIAVATTISMTLTAHLSDLVLGPRTVK